MAENSLFAVLMRSRWWISFAICAAVVLVSLAVFPKDISPFAALGAFPFFVVGCIAFYRQMSAPSPAQMEEIQQVIAAQSWADFSAQLQTAWQAEGYEVQRLNLPGADLLLTRNGQTSVVSARRWKAATHGVEPLRELHAAMQARGAQGGLYLLAQGSLSDNARLFARDHGITVVQGDALAGLLLAAR